MREKYRCSSDDEEEEEDKKEGEEEEGEDGNKKKNKEEEKQVKRKIKQSDIDALNTEKEVKKEDLEDAGGSQDSEDNAPSTSRPPLITHHVRNLSIDLTSNVVDMAHKSRQRMMKTKNTAKKREKKKKGGGTGGEKGTAAGGKEEKGTLRGLSDDSDTDEEVKKEKIRAILNWGTENKNTGPNLSDSDENKDSDDDEEVQNPSSPFQGFPHNPERKKWSLHTERRVVKREESDEEEEEDVSTSRSTTPEMDLSADEGKRRVSRRSVKRKVRNYKEEEGEDEEESDISLDESDFEDKSYVPELKKKRN